MPWGLERYQETGDLQEKTQVSFAYLGHPDSLWSTRICGLSGFAGAIRFVLEAEASVDS